MDKKENSKSVLVLGASLKPHRYSNRAILALKERGHTVHAIGRSVGELVNGVRIQANFQDFGIDFKVHTISVYLNEGNQSEYEEDIIALKPERVIFNPGAENADLYSKLRKEGIETLNACTLVMLSIGNF